MKIGNNKIVELLNLKALLALIPFLSFLQLQACSSKNQEWELVKPEYERISSNEIESQQIEEMPTEFKIRLEQLPKMWERAELFAQQYIGVTPTYVYSSGKGEPDSIGLQFASHNFSYLVTKRNYRDGTLIQVKCTVKNSSVEPSKALFNAKNLSRFIRDWRLQLTLLEK